MMVNDLPSGNLYNVLSLENKHIKALSSQLALIGYLPFKRQVLEHQDMGAKYETSEKKWSPAVRIWTLSTSKLSRER